MRREARLAVALSMVSAGACGLEEAGTAIGDASSDVTITNDGAPIEGGAPDVQFDVPNDIALPPTCATLDLSCIGLDAGAPDGWSPYVVASSCPSGDYTGTPWQTNPRLANGACACGCTAGGTYACPAQITVQNGGACGNTPITTDAGACTPAVPVSAHMELPNAQSATANSVACTPDASAAGAATDPVTLCAIGCDAGAQGLCGQPQGTRCIAADGIQACPNGLTQHIVGSGAGAACNACGCNVGDPPACVASAQVFYGYNQGYYHAADNCQTGGSYTSQTITLNQTCQATTNNYDSFIVKWGSLAAPSCKPDGGGGVAALASPKTVCCN